MFLISRTPFPSSVITHSHLTPSSSKTYIVPLLRYLSIISSCSSANSSNGRNCFFILLDFFNFHINLLPKFRFIFLLHYHISLLVSTIGENTLRSLLGRQEFPLDNLPKFFYTNFNCVKGKDGKEYARRWGSERRRWVQVSPRRRGRSSRSRLSEPTSTADRIPPLREKEVRAVFNSPNSGGTAEIISP